MPSRPAPRREPRRGGRRPAPGGTAAGRGSSRSTASGAGARRPQPSRPPATGVRAAVERRSAPILLRIVRLPRWLPALVAAGLLVTGLAADGVVGVVALAVVLVVLTWLAYLSWPRLPGTARVTRAAVLCLLAVALVLTALDRF